MLNKAINAGVPLALHTDEEQAAVIDDGGTPAMVEKLLKQVRKAEGKVHTHGAAPIRMFRNNPDVIYYPELDDLMRTMWRLRDTFVNHQPWAITLRVVLVTGPVPRDTWAELHTFAKEAAPARMAVVLVDSNDMEEGGT